MTVETKGDELIIKVSNVSIDEIKDFLDYIELKEITSTSKATQEDVDELAKESKRTWWAAYCKAWPNSLYIPIVFDGRTACPQIKNS